MSLAKCGYRQVERRELGKRCSFLAAALCVFVGLDAVAVELAPCLELRGDGHAAVQREAISAAAPSEIEHDLSLLGTLAIGEHGRVWMQVAKLSETRRVKLDFLCFDRDLTPQTTLRIGQTRLPLGFYNETRDLQALRVSASLPLLHGGDEGPLDEGLRGVVVDHRFSASEWVKFGIAAFLAWAVVPDALRAERGSVGGGRLSWDMPWPGLTFKLSGYGGRLEDVETGANVRQREQILVASAQYESGPWALAAEGAQTQAANHRHRVAHVQAARDLVPQWRAFVRAESLRDADPSSNEPARRRKRLSVGAAWQAAAHWGLRVEAARNSGRLDEFPEGVTPDTARSRWTATAERLPT